MTAFIFVNDINTQLAGSISSSATSITLASSQNLPSSIPAGQNLVITLRDAATRQNTEIVYATAITGTTLTVVRGQEGTTAQSWATGDYAYSGVTAGQMTGTSLGRLISVRTFTSSTTFNPSIGTNAIKVTLCGPGGGSGGVPASGSGLAACGVSGGGGGWSIGMFTSGFSGAAIVIGAGGAGGIPGTSGPTAGGTTSFMTMSASGGSASPNNGTAVAPPSVVGAAGGGIGTGGNIANGNGGQSCPGILVSIGNAVAGASGCSLFGGSVSNTVTNGGRPGAPGTSYGAGASGACNTQGNAANNGASGYSGVVIIEEYT